MPQGQREAVLPLADPALQFPVRCGEEFRETSGFDLTSSPSIPYKEMMSAAIAYTSVYEKRVGKVFRTEERNAMELHVTHHPEKHRVVAGPGGIRKARWGRQGKGKRGGAWVIYFYRSF